MALIEKTKQPKIIILAVLLPLVAAAYIEGQQYFNLAFVQSALENLTTYYNQNQSLFIASYVVGYALLVALYVPGPLILNLLAGAVFGPLLGAGLAVLSASIGSFLAFYVSRYFLHDWVREKYPKQAASVDKAFEETGVFYIFLLRLAPALPVGLTNLLMGVTNVSGRVFFVATLIGVVPWISFYTFAGAELASLKSIENLISMEMTSLALALVGLLLLGHVIMKRVSSPKTT